MTHTHPHGSVCLLPPSIPGSVGDEKVMLTCLQQLRVERIILLNYEQSSWDRLAPHAESISLFGARESTAYYRQKGLKKLLHIAKILLSFAANLPSLIGAFRRSKLLIILGMDIMDGHYGVLSALHKIILAYGAKLLGTNVSIINCSFNEHPSSIIVWALRLLPKSVRIVARDPFSHARMEKFLHRKIVLAADVSFLFEIPRDTPNTLQHISDWIDGQRAEGRIIIGINIADNKNYDIDTMIRICTETIRTMHEASFVLIPHATYTRKNLPDENALMRSILSGLSEDDRKRCTIIELPCSIADLQKTLECVDYGVVGRMHLAIGMLCAKVPACCIRYQDKFDGLFQEYLHAPELLIDMGKVLSDGSFATLVRNLIPMKRQESDKIAKALHGLKELARKNFE